MPTNISTFNYLLKQLEETILISQDEYDYGPMYICVYFNPLVLPENQNQSLVNIAINMKRSLKQKVDLFFSYPKIIPARIEFSIRLREHDMYYELRASLRFI